MARHKTDPTTAGLLEEMPETRQELRIVIAGLNERGITSGQIARTAGWNPGYLSEFLARDAKKPTKGKIDALLSALQVFVVTAPAALPFAETLSKVAERYGQPMALLANPAAGPIAVGAPNYVHRVSLEHSLRRMVPLAGTYAIDGPPMSGVSSALLHVEGLLRKQGFEICRISAKSEPLDPASVERSHTKLLGALAAAMTRSTEPLTMDFFGVQEAIRDRLLAAPTGFALVLDDINSLDDVSTASLKSLLRDWATRRASREPAFASATAWLAYTSNVASARFRSQLIADQVFTGWFEKEEVRALADALAPYAGVSAEAPSMSMPVGDAVRNAWDLFRGQPNLTHLYLWDVYRNGTAASPAETLGAIPSGAYERHLDRLARSLVDVLSTTRTSILLRTVAANENPGTRVTPAEQDAAVRLGILTVRGDWACPYYRTRLTDFIRRVVGR